MILTSENQKWLAEKLDDVIKLKGLLELVDGYVAKVLISYIDLAVDKKVAIPDVIKNGLNDLVEAAKQKDVDLAEDIAAEVLDALIDIPGLDDDSEKLLFEGAVKLIVGAIKAKLG